MRITRDLLVGDTGSIAGSATAAQMPNIPCRMVMFKAVSDNAGRVHIGKSGVTVAAGTTTTTAGWQLTAREETPFLPCGNMNEFYYIGDNAGDDLVYLYLL